MEFLKFCPGLVGGHCIGVDPYYLAFRANEFGVESNVILSSRSTNNAMSTFGLKRQKGFCWSRDLALKDPGFCCLEPHSKKTAVI